jgi:hypothetical protein
MIQLILRVILRLVTAGSKKKTRLWTFPTQYEKRRREQDVKRSCSVAREVVLLWFLRGGGRIQKLIVRLIF